MTTMNTICSLGKLKTLTFKIFHRARPGPIKATASADIDQILGITGDLRQEKQFLLETTGLVPQSNSDQQQQSEPAQGGKAYIVPTLQMNVINYREDEQIFTELIKQLLQNDSKLRLGTGYLNIQSEIWAELMRSKSKIELLTSSPKANGFYNGGRVKKYIPGLYR